MAITSAEVLAYVNARLVEDFAIADIDTELKEALEEISKRGNFLEREVVGTLSSGQNEIPRPDYFKELQTITLDDGDNYAITAVDTDNKKFTVSGDQTADFSADDLIRIKGSTGNDGTYTVVTATLVSSNTEIVVSETVSDSTIDGSIIVRGERLNDFALIKMTWDYYKKLLYEGLSTGTPTHRTYHNKTFYLNYNANNDMTYTISYIMYHPQSYSTILFDDEFRTAIYKLTASKVAENHNMDERVTKLEKQYNEAFYLLGDKEITIDEEMQPNTTYFARYP